MEFIASTLFSVILSISKLFFFLSTVSPITTAAIMPPPLTASVQDLRAATIPAASTPLPIMGAVLPPPPAQGKLFTEYLNMLFHKLKE